MDNQNYNQSMPESSQMPQNAGHKSKFPLIIGGVAILIALVFGGVYLYKTSKVNPPINTQPENQVQQNPENTIGNNPTTSAVSCENFSEISDYVFKTIQSPDSQNVMQMNPYVITSFRWKRNTPEPFITYPIINGIQAFYGDQNNFRSNDFITSAIKNDSKLISQSINEKAKELGFVADSLNTLPLQTFSNKDVLQLFAFRKGSDIYSVVLRSEWGGYQAPGRSTVTVTCGKAVSEYDKVYNALNLKIILSVENHYNDDYVAISDVSADGKVYALTGSPSQIKIAGYYYFDGNSLKLISKDSYPTQCAPLESQRVGKGMRCVDPNNSQRTVNY